jgi:tetratricopeptide (TPR) repeat protein
MTVDEALKLATKHYEAGNFQQAEHICREILEKQPNNVETLYFLGIIYIQLHQSDSAIQHIQRSLQINPANADAYLALGTAFQQKGLLDESVSCYQKTINIDPNNADPFNLLGNIFKDKGRLDDAMSCYQKALQFNPNYTDAYINLGIILHDKGQLDEAISCYQKVLQINPNYADAFYKLGNAFQEKKQFDKAMSYYQKAIQLNPTLTDAFNNLGISLKEKGQLDEAIQYWQKALQLDPTYTNAYNNLGCAFKDKMCLDEAVIQYKKALEIDPNAAETHFNLSGIFLLNGNFHEGWREYEWRNKLKEFRHRIFKQPLWDGFDISKSTILTFIDKGLKGFGDTIQFIRYAPLVSQCGAKVIVECQKELESILKGIKGIDQVIKETQDELLPAFDTYCPLLSLPFIFKTNLANIPNIIPYITADTLLVKQWKSRIQYDHAKFKIGLVWSGDPKHKTNIFRSCPLDILKPLAGSKDIILYSLQKGDVEKPPQDMGIIDYTEEIRDFSDTAALIENFDLVISVDTAVAHLAGALGKPIWTLLPFAPDWRWMLNREDSPWYPTMRLFRQPAPGDWESVISKVKDELLKLLDKK